MVEKLQKKKIKAVIIGKVIKNTDHRIMVK